MSSGDEYIEKPGREVSKRRKLQRACDVCRRKKIRCDGVLEPGNPCTNCNENGLQCTYVEAAKRRGPPKSYVEKLEKRVEKLQELICKISPEALKALDDSPPLQASSVTPNRIQQPTSAKQQGASHSTRRFFQRTEASLDFHPHAVDTNDGERLLGEYFANLDVEIDHSDRRYFGKSSGVFLAKAMLQLKKRHMERAEASEFGQQNIKESEPLNKVGSTGDLLSGATKTLFQHPPSEPYTNINFPIFANQLTTSLTTPQYVFPPPDLISSLVDLYFIHMNTYLPLLHRPTFERAIATGLHHKDSGFAAVLLLTCAVAARYSNDERVMDDLEHENSQDGADSSVLNNDHISSDSDTDVETDTGVEWRTSRRIYSKGKGKGKSKVKPQRQQRNPHSCGWKWFSQVRSAKLSPLSPPSLYELQYYVLLGQFLQASSVPQACWTVVGMGIRAAQDVGAHRKRSKGEHTVEDELWKRAFWVLICMDRLFSSSLGRPCSIHDEDFDLDLPLECDDEYWEHPDPTQRWRQPASRTPSIVKYFNVYIKLNQILGFLLKTVYAINKHRILFGLAGERWEESIVAELDAALNVWVDNVPDHLRWDPTRQHALFFNQSASLYSFYYHIQILLHRPFISSTNHPGSLAFPSLAICTNAARSCSNVVDIQRKKLGVAPPPLITATYSSGVVLLLSIWGGKRSGLSLDFDKEMADVYKCMNVLKNAESRWHLAGRLYDILCQLATVGDLPLSQKRPPATKGFPTGRQKRERDPEREESIEPPPELVSAIIPLPPPIPTLAHQEPTRKLRVNTALSTPILSLPQDMHTIFPARHEHTRCYNACHEPPHNQYHPSLQLSSYEATSPTYIHLGTDHQTPEVQVQEGLSASSHNIPLQPPPLEDSRHALSQLFYPTPSVTSYTNADYGRTDYPAPFGHSRTHFATQAGHGHEQLSYPFAGNVEPSYVTPSAVSEIGGTQQPHSTSIPNDVYAMWSDAPPGFGLSEWALYINNVSG